MVDKVRPLKYERSPDGTENNRRFPTETDPQEDYIAAKGISFENSNETVIDLDAFGDIRFKDVTNPLGRTLKSITEDISSKETSVQLDSRDTANRNRTNHTGVQAISTITGLQLSLDAKYDASNPSAFETPSQLNTRDSANRSRVNHTGTQTSSTISDFAATVLATILTGFTSSNAVITATDTVLQALNKAQGQVNAILSALGFKADKSTTISAGTGLTGGGDLSANRTISMPSTGTAGTYGSASQVPVVTTDAQGRVGVVVSTTIAIVSTQVTDFLASVRATTLPGISLVAGTVTAADSVIGAIGKLWGTVEQYFVSTAPQSTGSLNVAGTSTALARADHVHDTVLNDITVFSTTSTTTTSATQVLMNGMTVTPPAGKYLVTFGTSVQSSANGAEIAITVYANNAKIIGSERAVTPKGSNQDVASTPRGISTSAIVTVNGSQAIQGRWDTSSGTATARERSLSVIRIG